MFTTKVRFLLSQLGASNSDIAHHMGVNPSIISRLRTGNSKPKIQSFATQHFIEGVYEFSAQNNRLPLLASIVGKETTCEEPEFKKALKIWLYSPDATDLEQNQPDSSLFGEKLTSLMRLLDLSNVKLARSINIDPSYISHFKSGKRVPHVNNRILNDVCDTLTEQILLKKKFREFADLILVPTVPHTQTEIKLSMLNWLSDSKKEISPSPVANLFEYINNLEPNSIPLPPVEQIATEDVLNTAMATYYGLEGFRQAVIRFLATAAQKGKELLLYSDQSMDWMTEDKTFLLSWAALMNHCIRSGIKIKIIHNINRDFSEMLVAIKSWAPLYMSGMIEPYFCKKEPDVRFSNTIFLCPNVSAIEATHVRNFEQTGTYEYRTNPFRLSSLEEQFNGLLQNSVPLLKVFTAKDRDNFLFALTNQPLESGTCILSTLPISTMPQEVVDALLAKHPFTEEEKNAFLTYWKVQKEHLYKCLEGGISYTQCLPLFDKDTVAKGQLPLDLHNIAVTKYIHYTEQDYYKHLRHIFELYQTHANFQILPLEQELFHNIQVKVGSKHVILMKNNAPQIAFVFTNPAMQVAFQKYLHQLIEIHHKDRKEVIQRITSSLKTFE